MPLYSTSLKHRICCTPIHSVSIRVHLDHGAYHSPQLRDSALPASNKDGPFRGLAMATKQKCAVVDLALSVLYLIYPL